MRHVSKLGIVTGILLSAFGALPVGAGPYLPQVGDELRYGVSNGDVAVTRVIRTRSQGDRVYAQVVQTLLRQGSEPQTTRFTFIRAEEGLAIQVTPIMEGLQLSPLVYYLSVPDATESWTAQKGSYRDSAGQEVGYELTAEFLGLETVKVTAGTFEGCARIAYRSNLAPSSAVRPSEMVFWVKPEIGIVKTRSLQDGRVTETELLSFERATFAHP